MNENMKIGNAIILEGIKKSISNANYYEEKQMYQTMRSQIYKMENDVEYDGVMTSRDLIVLKCNQIIDDVLNGKDIKVMDVSILLQHALKDVESKKDLCDSELDEIKTIRATIKGL